MQISLMFKVNIYYLQISGKSNESLKVWLKIISHFELLREKII